MNQIARPEAAITKRRAFYWVWRFAVLAVICALIAVVAIRAFFVDVFSIRSDSMQPTLNPGQSISVDRRAYTDSDPQRGDVIVFDGRGSFLPYARSTVLDDLTGALKLSGSSNSYVKRVIGIGGDTVECCTVDGKLAVNGQPLDEPYLYPGDAPSEMNFVAEVPAGRVWVMGDHRLVSQDSRSLLGASGGGMISLDRINGRVTNIIWPSEQRTEIR